MIRSRFFNALILGLGLLVILACVVAGMMRHILSAPALLTEPVYLYIEAGQSPAAVARQAAALGLVENSLHFRLAVRWRGLARSLYSGEYEILPGEGLHELLDKVSRRTVYLRRIVVPEGLSVVEVVPILKGSFGLVDDISAMPPEGSLLPDTYFYERGDKASVVVKRMRQSMTEALISAWERRDGMVPFSSPEEALVLASIVEKETAVDGERPLVAAVFVNRLKRGMRLQSDPTVIYGIVGGAPFERAISRTDLRQLTPYNTYKISGLPPTPIANPGRAAIEAVMNPAPVGYLYFVADGSGGHAFASTLREHNLNVARWRKLGRQSR